MSLQYVDSDSTKHQNDQLPATIVHIQQHLRVDKPDTIMREKVHITATGLRPHENYRMNMK